MSPPTNPGRFNEPATQTWWIRWSTTGLGTATVWGSGTAAVPIAADYDGDGRVDMAVYDAGTRTVHIRRSVDGVTQMLPMAGVSQPGDLPVLRRPQ